MRVYYWSKIGLLPFVLILGGLLLVNPASAQIEPRRVTTDITVYQIDNLGNDVFNVDPLALNPALDWQTKVELRMSALDISPQSSLVPWGRQFLVSGRNSSANVKVGPAQWSLNSGYFPVPEISFVNLFMATFFDFTGTFSARDIDTFQNVPNNTIVTFDIQHFGADGELHTVSFCGNRFEPVVTGLEHVIAIQSGGFGSSYTPVLFSEKNSRVTNQQGDVIGNCAIDLIWKLPAAPPLPDLPPVGFDSQNPDPFCSRYSTPENGAIDARQYHESGQGGTGGCNDPSAEHPDPNLQECQEGNFQGWDHVDIRFDGDVGYFDQELAKPGINLNDLFTLSADSLYSWSHLNRVPQVNGISSIERVLLSETDLECLENDGNGRAVNALRINFSRPIDYVSWTKVTSLTTNDSVTLGFLPGDVNQNATSTKKDCKKLKKYLKELVQGHTLPFVLTEYQSNINRDILATGEANLEWPEDHIACQDLINGHGHGYREFKGVRLPCYDDDDDGDPDNDSSDNECDDES